MHHDREKEGHAGKWLLRQRHTLSFSDGRGCAGGDGACPPAIPGVWATAGFGGAFGVGFAAFAAFGGGFAPFAAFGGGFAAFGGGFAAGAAFGGGFAGFAAFGAGFAAGAAFSVGLRGL
jgi:hypothetical protein